MIDEAIQQQLTDAGLSASEINAAQGTDMPFVVYDIRTDPRLTKDAKHYATASKMIVVDPDITVVRTKADEVIAAINNMLDQTIADTEITGVTEGPRQPDYQHPQSDDEQGVYLEEIEFTINHKNP